MRTAALLLLIAPGTALADDGPLPDPGAPVVVQSDEDGGDDDDLDLDDLLGSDSDTEESIQEENESLRKGDLDDRPGVTGETPLPGEEDEGPRLIKTIERKTFLKLGRFEASPFVGFVTNDPFINRYMLGSGIAYHLTEIFAVELTLGYSPDFGDSIDYKPLTDQLIEENKVSPDISKFTLFSYGAFQFSPFYGKVAINNRNIIKFDIYGSFGMGFTLTQDDLSALGDEDSVTAQATAVQWHPTTNISGGARVIFNQSVAMRIEGRSLIYIETIDSTTLQMKNNFILTGAAAFFFPRMER